jgi:hypothetical protein
MKDTKPEVIKEAYEKPEVFKEGGLTDITAGGTPSESD